MVRLSDLIEGVGGELSPFEELHGFALEAWTSQRPCYRLAGESASSWSATNPPKTR